MAHYKGAMWDILDPQYDHIHEDLEQALPYTLYSIHQSKAASTEIRVGSRRSLVRN